MEKVVFVAFSSPETAQLTSEAVAAFNDRLLDALDAATYPDLAVQIEEADDTTRWQRLPRPAARRVVATIAAWTECGDDVGPLAEIVADRFPDHAGLVVTEAIPRWRNPRVTSTSAPQEGVIVTSLLFRSPAMSHDEFVSHWRDVHQPMSLRIHPQWTYVRNVAVRPLTPDAPPLDAICEEGFASVDDVLEPSRFYGGDLSGSTWRENAQTIGDDVRIFLDTDRTTSTIAREYRLRDFRRR